MKENYDACFEHVLGSEGGFSDDPHDSGNYTGCKVGVGQMKGTNWGVSACAYPTLDIRNLSQKEAKAIYQSDYWTVLQGDYLPWGVDLCAYDSGINSGNSRGAKWLQRAVGSDVDGVVGPQTITLARTAEDHVTVDRMCDDRLNFLKNLSTWPRYGKGWTTRIENVRKDAHKMVDAHKNDAPAPPPIPLTGECLVAVTVPEGINVTVLVNGVER